MGLGRVPNPRNGVLKRREQFGEAKTGREDGHVIMKATTRVMQLQAKGHQERTTNGSQERSRNGVS